jgi:hypothetical protein
LDGARDRHNPSAGPESARAPSAESESAADSKQYIRLSPTVPSFQSPSVIVCVDFCTRRNNLTQDVESNREALSRSI